ncbi:patatin-like phospholipase family protein [Myxococcota bacterium]
MTKPLRIALCLPGGGATGAMYQIGALAALEDVVEGLNANEFDFYVGASSGASVAAILAGGRPIQRLYRAFLDPADQYFALERKHIFVMDFGEWRRTIATAGLALRRGAASLLSRGTPSPTALWEELDRLTDSLPAGVFTLETYERFLEDFFARRSIANAFNSMRRPLRVTAHDLDSGQTVVFGCPGHDQVPVSRACIASMAVPPFFSPVRIGSRHYINAGPAQLSHLDVAVDANADVVVVINPMVPICTTEVPTGHGKRPSVRDKGAVWVTNQAMRLGTHRLMREAAPRIAEKTTLLLLEPEPTDSILFMHNPASFAARRSILEEAYRATRTRLNEWFDSGHTGLQRAEWRRKTPILSAPDAGWKSPPEPPPPNKETDIKGHPLAGKTPIGH